MTTTTKIPIKSLRQLELLSDFGPVIWETHSLVNEEGDFLEEGFDKLEACKDIQEWFSFSDKLIKEMSNKDMIQVIRDCAGVQIQFCREYSEYMDRIISNIEPVLQSCADDEDNITFNFNFMNDLCDLWEEEGYEPDEDFIDAATRCGIVWWWNKEYGLGDPIDMDDVVDYEHKGDYWCCQGITWFSIKRK
jgi:hypothetical protein